jgi:hypothetical protein
MPSNKKPRTPKQPDAAERQAAALERIATSLESLASIAEYWQRSVQAFIALYMKERER